MAPSMLQEELGRYNVARERRKPKWSAFWKLLGYSLIVAALFYVTAAMSGAFEGRWWAFPALGMLWFFKKAFDQYAIVWGSRTPVATKIYGSAENATLEDVKRAGMTGTYPPERRLYLGLQVLVEEENGEKTFKKTGHLVRSGGKKSDSYQTSTLVLGTTGAGKTLGLVAQTTLLDGSLLIVDTGEVAAMAAKMRERRGFGETIILDPMGHLVALTGDQELKSWGYNPMFSIVAPRRGQNEPIDTHFVRKCSNLAKAAIRRSFSERATDSHWLETAEQVLAGLFMWECLEKAPAERSYGNVRDEITGGAERIQIIAAKAKKKYPELKEIQRKLGRFAATAEFKEHGRKIELEDAGNELKSVISALDTQTVFLDDDEYVRDLCPRGGNRFTWSDLKTNKRTVMLVLPPHLMADENSTGQWWLRLLISDAANEMLATPRNTAHAPVRFVLDEFPHLGRMSSVVSALNLGRKHGLTFMLLGQNLAQFESVYGPTALLNMESACGTKICYRTRDQKTAAHFSALAGQTTVTTKSESVHKTVPEDTYQYRPEGVPLWPNIDIAKLPDRTAIVICSDLPGKTITVETPGIYEPALAPWRKYMEANPYAP